MALIRQKSVKKVVKKLKNNFFEILKYKFLIHIGPINLYAKFELNRGIESLQTVGYTDRQKNRVTDRQTRLYYNPDIMCGD